MPGAEKRDMHQTAVFWEFAGNNPDGEPVLYNPEEISVRWVENIIEGSDPRSTQSSSKITVNFTRQLSVDSLLRLGTLAESVAAGNDNLKQVMKSGAVPDLKNRRSTFTMELISFNDRLPTLVGTAP